MSANPPDALLFITTGCSHCPLVMSGLGELVKQAKVGKLTIVNVASHPELAAEYGVRAAPWLRLGDFTLTGSHSPEELRQWAEWSSGEEGARHYVEHLLKEGGYKQAVAYVANDTSRLKPLLAIVADPEKSIEVRVGVDALLESYSKQPPLQILLPELAQLTLHSDHRVRADACNLLGLSGSAEARPILEKCLNDSEKEVRQIAAESLQLLDQQVPRAV